MKSSHVKTVRNILTVLGVLGSLIMGQVFQLIDQREIYFSSSMMIERSYNWPLVAASLISVALVFFGFTIVATIMENQEHIISILRRLDVHSSGSNVSSAFRNIKTYSSKDKN